MKILSRLLILAALLTANSAFAQGGGTITQLQQFVSTSSPSSAITQASYGKALKITGLSTGLCLTLDSNNLLTTTSCGSGGGGTGVGTVATSSLETAGRLPYWTTTSGYPAKLGSVATTTLTASGILSLSQPISVIGGSASVLTLTGGTAGQVLGWSNGIPTWIASTTYASPLSFANNQVTLSTAGTWSGNAGTATAFASTPTKCSAGNYPLGIDASGNAQNCTAAGTGSTFPFTPSATGNSTSTNLYFLKNIGIGTSTFANNDPTTGVLAISQGLEIGSSSPVAITPNTPVNIVGNVNGYYGVTCQNKNSGTTASCDFLTNNDLTDTVTPTYYGDLGQNSSGNTSGGFLGDKNGVYLYNSDGSLSMEAASTTNANAYLRLGTGGVEALRITNPADGVSIGKVGIGTTTPTSLLSVQGNQYTSGTAFFGGAFTATSTVTFSKFGQGVMVASSTGVLSSIATSTLYGTGTGGQVLGWDNNKGGLGFVATSSVAGSAIPGGSLGQIQWNSNSTFAGISTTTTGTANQILSLNGSQNTTIPFASTTDLTIGGFTISTTTTVCVAPEMCQFQVAKGATNAEVVINQAMNYATSSGGGAVHIKAGTYNLGEAVQIGSNTLVYGDGPATIIKVHGTDNPTNGSNGIWINGTAANQSNITIENINCDGTNQNGTTASECIHVAASGFVSQNIKIINNTFTNVYGFAIFADANISGGVAKTTNLLIQGNTFSCHSAQDCIGGGPGENPDSISSTTQISVLNNTILKDTTGGVDYNCLDITGGQQLKVDGNECNGLINIGNEANPNTQIDVSNNTINPIPNSTIAGQLIIDNSHADTGGQPANPRQFNVENNQITEGNIEILGNGTSQARNLIISGNTIVMAPKTWTFFATSTAAISVDQNVTPTISGNVIDGTLGSGSTGIAVTNSTNATAEGNTINNFQFGTNLYGGTNNRSILNNYNSNTTNEAGITNDLTFDTSGRLGVGTSSPWRQFAVSGTVGFANLSTGTGAGALCLTSNNEVVFSSGANCVAGGGSVTGLATSTPISAGNLLVYSASGAGSAFGIATTTTGVASDVLSLNASQFTTLPFASTTAITASGELGLPNGSSITTTVTGDCVIDTTDGQLKCGNGGSTVVFDQRRFYSFGYSTTTAWTGTTTQALAPYPVAGTLKSIVCTTNAGTLGVDLYYGPTPTHLAYIPTASTTANTFSWTANNTPGINASSTVAFGTPASSPTSVQCTATFTLSGT